MLKHLELTVDDRRRAAEIEEQSQSQERSGVVLWLVWLLPNVGLALVLGYVFVATFGIDPRATAALVAQGRLGELLLAVIALGGWVFSLAGTALTQNWPLALVGVSLVALFWSIRYL